MPLKATLASCYHYSVPSCLLFYVRCSPVMYLHFKFACWINTELLCVPISSPADGSLYLYQLTTPSKCQTVSCQLPRQHLQNRNVTVSELSVYFISFWCHRKRTPVWRTPKLHNIYESNVQGFLTKHVFLLYYLFI